MALLRNREVELLGPADGEDASPNYNVKYPDGSRETVKLNQIQLTEKEAEDIKKYHGENSLINVSVIKDKDLQEIRDSQDRAKIEKNQKSQSQDPVPVNKVMVDPNEVSQKSNKAR